MPHLTEEGTGLGEAKYVTFKCGWFDMAHLTQRVKERTGLGDAK